MENYNPGTHILSTFTAPHAALTDMVRCADFFSEQVTALGLTAVGSVYHAFDNGGFTAVICLVESHISIHTWPEHGLATFDVFLSNFRNDNGDKVQAIYRSTLEFFGGTETNLQTVMR